MQKIEKGTHKGLFDWILESENHVTHSETNSVMIRVLVEELNKMVDKIEELSDDIFELRSRNIRR